MVSKWIKPTDHYDRERMCYCCWRVSNHDGKACPEAGLSIYERELRRRNLPEEIRPELSQAPRWKKKLKKEYNITEQTSDEFLKMKLKEEKDNKGDEKATSTDGDLKTSSTTEEEPQSQGMLCPEIYVENIDATIDSNEEGNRPQPKLPYTPQEVHSLHLSATSQSSPPPPQFTPSLSPIPERRTPLQPPPPLIHPQRILNTPFGPYIENGRPCCQFAIMVLNTRIAAVEAQVIEIIRVLKGGRISPIFTEQMLYGVDPQLYEIRSRLAAMERIVHQQTPPGPTEDGSTS